MKTFEKITRQQVIRLVETQSNFKVATVSAIPGSDPYRGHWRVKTECANVVIIHLFHDGVAFEAGNIIRSVYPLNKL